MLFLWVVLARASACPTYSCSSIDPGYCAVLGNDDNVKFTSKSCGEGSGCSLLSIVNFAYAGVAACTIDTTTEVSSSFTTQCINRPRNVDLLEGSHPKICDSSRDCQIQNGNYSVCVCSFSGSSYCQPELGSNVFDFYWNDCEAHNNTVSRGEILTLLDLVYVYYVYAIKPPSCMVKSIYELSRMGSLARILKANGTEELPIMFNYDYFNGTTDFDDIADEEEDDLEDDDEEDCGWMLGVA
eukprot:CAMPEP_0204909208 /NCGR_PEP_ID=MMETSP1397-20131031/7979_1 /ASSEMBLY_ACC=CAM_ASM_000891 /TAXON_ID=49980 /ORGANISM="Climacostomum Climacostomum virens, Strain Stock W-24" /LENGTH=240 /DNA_ID=CAMNT_0052078965 /DNA_START=481 /DNA_END=1199 /DNA_ORIENTATION=-